MALNSELRVRLTARQTGSNDISPPEFAPKMEAILQLASGTGADQADILYMDERTVSASTNDDLDLAGVLTNAFGATITAAEMVALLIIADDDNTTDLTVGLGTNPFLGFLGGTTPTVGPLKAGGVFLIACPGAAGIGTVGAGASDILRIANGSGASATYRIAILARSA